LSFSEAIVEAAARKAPLRIRGGGTKDFYGNAPRGEIVDTRAHAGIVDYEPTELVITARCGTPLAEVERLLEAKAQSLPFEPPHFGAGATFGGCVAAGLSGPRRASAGALRDFVLGLKMLDGRGRELSFGGRVMKNVAGYDVSRLVAGSLGTLGLILEASLKVLPRPPAETTLRLEARQDEALVLFARWGALPLPISATAWVGGEVFVRLSGSETALRPAAARIGGTPIPGDQAAALWRAIREHEHPFFSSDTPLWRLAVPAVAAPLGLAGSELLEWGGGLRWLKSAAPAATVREAARREGGHATLFRAAEKPSGTFAPRAPANLRLHRALKDEFDPAGIFNPGRMYPEL
jgi:glycolate oxidase FAD binding subunit